MSENYKIDRRVIRTQNLLWEALRALLQLHSWDNINIKLICHSAGVARSSFYAHFGTKTELLDYGFGVVLSDLFKLVSEQSKCERSYHTTNWLVDHISENPGFFMKLSELGSDKFLFARFTIAIEEVLLKEIQTTGRYVETDTVIFAVSGSFAIIKRWMDNKCVQSDVSIKQKLNSYLGRVIES